MNTPTKTNPSSFKEQVEAKRDLCEAAMNVQLALGADENAAVAEGEIKALEWLLDQDPIVLSGEDREELERAAVSLDRAAEFAREHRLPATAGIWNERAEFLRNLAAGGERT